ncbi:MAG TPA: formylglycine-generating enzyme family protein [Spirochaetota bacterium]|nr:formylglycine-generating enzyme family protein [Spirochaetota bacterium]
MRKIFITAAILFSLLLCVDNISFASEKYYAENFGTGVRKTGGTYAAIEMAKLQDSDNLQFKCVSGQCRSITVHGRKQGEPWSTVYQGRIRDINIGTYIGNRRSRFEDILIFVNGAHQSYNAVAAKLEINIASGKSEPSAGGSDIAAPETEEKKVTLITSPRKGGVVSINNGSGVRKTGGSPALIYVPNVKENLKLSFDCLSGNCSYIAIHGYIFNDRNKALTTDGDLLYKGPMKDITLAELHKNKAYYYYYKVIVNGFYSGFDKNPASVEVVTGKISGIAVDTAIKSNYKLPASIRTKIVGGIEFVYVPAGCFMMGSNRIPMGTPVHRVCLKGFRMSRYEITQSQWQAVMGTTPWYFKSCGGSCPVEQVSWNDVQAFISKFNSLHKSNVKLPSESQWEYAARGGTTSEYYWGDSVNGDYAWYERNSNFRPHPAGEKKPNLFGLSDMSGNVSEWVQDCFNYDYKGAPIDGSPWLSGKCNMRVHRGGSASHKEAFLKSADRQGITSGARTYTQGFRIIIPE